MIALRRSGTPGAGSPAFDDEFMFGDKEFRRIATLIHEDAGIYMPDAKKALVYSRLSKRLRVLGLETFHQYCDLVSGPDGASERHEMLVALTTNLTSFFREPHHFEHLKTTTLPPLLEAARRGGRVRLWSAGCSRGHEPYSIAMAILSVLPNAAEHDIKILATDIDTAVIAEGRAGLYDEKTVARVPATERQRFLVRTEKSAERPYSVGNDLRRLVSFRALNLVGPWPMHGSFDVIFCRNVLIYFDEPTQETLWERFSAKLAPEGHLYIGHSERVSGPAQHSYDTVGVTTYRRAARRLD